MNSKNSCPCHLSHLHIFPFASNVKHIYCPQLIFQTMWLLHFGSLGLILCPQCLPLKSRSTLPFVLMPILFLLDWCLFYILQFWHRSRFPIFCFSLAMSIFHFAIILHFPLLCFFPVTYLRTSSSSIVVPWSRWSRIDESGQTQPACTGDIACATVDMHAHRSVWTVGQSPALSVCAFCLCKPTGCILLWKRQALVCQACVFKHWQSHASMPRLANTITFFPWKTPQQKLLVFLQQIHPPLQIGSTDWRNRINANLSITLALNNNHINNGAHWQEEERQEKGEQSRACCKGQGQSKRGSKGVVGFSIKGDIGTNKEERCTNNEGYKCWRSTWKDACRKEINGVWETFCQTGETNQEEEPSVADSLVNHLSSWKSFEMSQWQWRLQLDQRQQPWNWRG